MFKNLSRLMDEVAVADGGGAPAAAPAPSAAPAATPTPAATPAPSSALSAAAPDPNAWIPEKVRVMREDGSLDLEASFRKTTESYSNLEKRFGSGDVPPTTPEEYKLAGLPETIKVEDLKADPGMQSFLKGAHAKGMTDAQVAYAINEHARLIHESGLVQALSPDQCDEYLAQAWTDDKTFSDNKAFAFKGAEVLSKKIGISMEDVEASGLGNHPLFIRMMAAIGPELGEDNGVIPDVTQSEAETAESLMKSEAYMNPKHADHKKVNDQVRAFYAKKYGATPVA